MSKQLDEIRNKLKVISGFDLSLITFNLFRIYLNLKFNCLTPNQIFFLS